jgi:hypothetical protein
VCRTRANGGGRSARNCSAQTPTGCLTKRNGNTLITEAVSGRFQ